MSQAHTTFAFHRLLTTSEINRDAKPNVRVVACRNAAARYVLAEGSTVS